ncbi:MAG: GldG family protein [Elusimicrobia bacterium]|nr:GldG family protein [Elusimicrobiota bacterium]
MSRGVIDLRNIVYFISLFILFIYGSLAAFSGRVRSVFQKAASFGLLAGILVLVNLLLSGAVIRMDLTSNNIYSLSAPSKKLMRSLDDPVIVKAFFSEKLPGQYRESKNYLRDLLYEYRAYSKGRLSFNFIDPTESEEYAIEAASYGIPPLQFTEAGKESYEVRQGYMGIAVLYGDRAETIPVLESVSGIEYDLSTRIKKLVAEEMIAVGYIGEPAIPDGLAGEVRKRYSFIQISSTQAYSNNQFSSVILAGRDFSEEDIELLSEAIDRGIPLALLVDRYSADTNSFSVTEENMEINKLLESYGISIGEGIIADRQAQRIGVTTQQGFFRVQNVVDYPYFPLLTDFSGDNPVVRDIDAAVFPFVSPIEILDEEDQYEVRVLAKTSKNSWLIRQPGNVSPMVPPVRAPGAATGPFPVAAAVHGKSDQDFRMLVTSNARFFEEDMLHMQANRSLFNNIIDWLSEDADLIAIRSKGISSRPLKEVSAGQMTLIKNLNMFLVPVLIVILGLIRWKTQNKRRNYQRLKYLI